MKLWKCFEGEIKNGWSLSFWFDTERWGIQLSFVHREGFYLVMSEFLCFGVQWYVNTMPIISHSTRTPATSDPAPSA